MNENHSYGCYNDQVAMGLHDLNKAQIVYPEPTTLEQRAEEKFKTKPLGYEMKPELAIYTDGYIDGATEETKEAREIIRRLLDILRQFLGSFDTETTLKAEQFLGDIEK